VYRVFAILPDYIIGVAQKETLMEVWEKEIWTPNSPD
jgi:hypothetical protein